MPARKWCDCTRPAESFCLFRWFSSYSRFGVPRGVTHDSSVWKITSQGRSAATRVPAHIGACVCLFPEPSAGTGPPHCSWREGGSAPTHSWASVCVKQPSVKHDRHEAADHSAVQVIQVLRKAVVEMYSAWMNSAQRLMQMTAFTVPGEHWGTGDLAGRLSLVATWMIWMKQKTGYALQTSHAVGISLPSTGFWGNGAAI